MKKKGNKHRLIVYVKRFVISAFILFILFLVLNALFPLKDKKEFSQTVFDSKGEIMHAFLTHDDKWRMFTELNEISPQLRKAIIYKEDRYFYSHPGVNPFAVVRALFNNITRLKRTSGASTITMQVARALNPAPRTFMNKGIEMFRALQLEWKYDKDEILQMYLNLVPYGGNIEGVKAASLLYFRKNPDHLSLAEIVALSIIPNRPSSLRLGKANDKILAERNKWLTKFQKDNVFTNDEISDALREPVNANRNRFPQNIPHLSHKLRQSGDLNIRTNIESEIQFRVEKITADYSRKLRLINIRNASVMIINNQTGKVVAYIGSADFRDTTDAGQVNGASAIRQPGSTLKPLLYGLSIDEGYLTPKSIINDIPVSYNGYNPENYDDKFNGPVTLEYALDHSLNIPAVKCMQKLGKDKLISSLVSCGFSQVQKDQHKLGLSMALGGCGTTLEELTGLFSVFANEGSYRRPAFVNAASGYSFPVITEASAYMLTEILSKVNRPDFPLSWSATEHMPKIAWKTGTSYGRRDAWSIGYNKNFTVGVWVGNFSGVGVPELSGANSATPLLFQIFNTIDYDSDKEWYSPPDEADIRIVCSATGMVPSPLCKKLITDQYIPLVSATKICDHIQQIKLSADHKISYCSMCAPTTGYVLKEFSVHEPDMQQYLLQQNRAVEMVPPHNPACEKLFAGNGPKIIAPKSSSEYYLSVKDPEPVQLTAYAAADVSYLYWYIDDVFYKKTKAGEKQFFVPREGPVKISCTDDKGRNTNVNILVRYLDL